MTLEPQPIRGRSRQKSGSFVSTAHSAPPRASQGISVSRETDAKPGSGMAPEHLMLVPRLYPLGHP